MNYKKIVMEEYYKLKKFGLSVVVFDMLSRLLKLPVFYRKKHEAILCCLKKKYEPVLKKYQSIPLLNNRIMEDYPIWVFWYQGFENAPELVKACLKSLKQCAGKHPVIELSKDNYRYYVQIPEYIEKKREEEKITITQYSDILRVSLLAKYGGCWTDATIFFNSWIHEKLDMKQWYSIKQKPQVINPMYVSEYRWSTFFQICSPDNIIAHYLKEILYLYWEEYSQPIDYFLQDYIFALGYRNILEMKRQIDDVPYNNPDTNWLNSHLEDKYDSRKYNRIIKKTAVFKLNWRSTVFLHPDTYYSKVILSTEEHRI